VTQPMMPVPDVDPAAVAQPMMAVPEATTQSMPALAPEATTQPTSALGPEAATQPMMPAPGVTQEPALQGKSSSLVTEPMIPLPPQGWLGLLVFLLLGYLLVGLPLRAIAARR